MKRQLLVMMKKLSTQKAFLKSTVLLRPCCNAKPLERPETKQMKHKDQNHAGIHTNNTELKSFCNSPCLSSASAKLASSWIWNQEPYLHIRHQPANRCKYTPTVNAWNIHSDLQGTRLMIYPMTLQWSSQSEELCMQLVHKAWCHMAIWKWKQVQPVCWWEIHVQDYKCT